MTKTKKAARPPRIVFEISAGDLKRVRKYCARYRLRSPSTLARQLFIRHILDVC